MLIKTATAQNHAHYLQPDFWSDVYSGRPIAILNHYGRLHVYLTTSCNTTSSLPNG